MKTIFPKDPNARCELRSRIMHAVKQQPEYGDVLFVADDPAEMLGFHAWLELGGWLEHDADLNGWRLGEALRAYARGEDPAGARIVWHAAYIEPLGDDEPWTEPDESE